MNSRKLNKFINLASLIILLFLFLIGFFFRFYGLLDNHPFWIDEFATVDQARILLKYWSSVF
ncbi:MAG: hypothetical protein ACD_49C00097G0001, partial [uncultured bacterium (gcode 4)]